MSDAVNKYIRVRVAEITELKGADARKFVFSPVTGNTLPLFRAGQYISLRLKFGGSCLSRPYSLCSSPADALEGKYAITVQNNPSGFAADRINSTFRVGTELIISSPQGDFYYEPHRDARNVVAIAGGSGITPFLSMAYAIRDGFENFNLTILNGNRTEDSVFFRKELDEIAAAAHGVRVINVLSDEDKPGFERGFIDAPLIRKYAEPPFSIYVCGPGPMYRFLHTEIPRLSLPPHLVRFGPPGVTGDVASCKGFPRDAAGKTFSLTVKQGSSVFSIKASSEEPVLVALERAGIDSPSLCRNGECGWCRSRLVSGCCFMPEETGEMRADSANGLIHPCACFPVSDLVLEVPEFSLIN